MAKCEETLAEFERLRDAGQLPKSSAACYTHMQSLSELFAAEGEGMSEEKRRDYLARYMLRHSEELLVIHKLAKANMDVQVLIEIYCRFDSCWMCKRILEVTPRPSPPCLEQAAR